MLLFYILQKSLIGQKNCIFSKDLFTYHFVLPILSKANLHPPIPGPRGLRRGSADARLLGLRVRIPLKYGCLSPVDVTCCRVEVSVTDRSPFQRNPTECVFVCDLESSLMRPQYGRYATGEKILHPLHMLSW